jgi:hypothetical protein
MKQRRRIYYSAVQRTEIWDRWQAGESMRSIGRRFDRASSSVFSVISPTGDIRPPVRHRAKLALTLSKREEISRWLSIRRSLRSVACHLRRSASTVSREVSRNGGADRYRAAGGRSGSLGSGAASQALQAGLPPVLEANSIDWAATTMVAGTNSWLAQAHLSGGSHKIRTGRPYLSETNRTPHHQLSKQYEWVFEVALTYRRRKFEWRVFDRLGKAILQGREHSRAEPRW